MDVPDFEGYTLVELPESLDERSKILQQHSGKKIIVIDRMAQYHGKKEPLRGKLIYDGKDIHNYKIEQPDTTAKRGRAICNIEMLLVENSE